MNKLIHKFMEYRMNSRERRAYSTKSLLARHLLSFPTEVSLYSALKRLRVEQISPFTLSCER